MVEVVEMAAPGNLRPSGPVGSELSGGARLEIAKELRGEWLRIVTSLRRAVHASVELDAPPARLRELADRVAEITRELLAHASGRPVPLYHPDPDGVGPDGLNALLPFSPITGRYNPLAPPVSLALEGEMVVARVRLQEGFQGAPGLVHGGVLASIFDEVLGMAAIARGQAGPTARLSVDYRKPTPLHADLRFEASVDRVQRRRAHVSGRCLADGELTAEAEAIYVRPLPGGWLRRSGD